MFLCLSPVMDSSGDTLQGHSKFMNMSTQIKWFEATNDLFALLKDILSGIIWVMITRHMNEKEHERSSHF